MNKYTVSNILPQNEYWDFITSTLSSYEAEEILPNGEVKTYKVEDNYFLVNDIWEIDTVGQIPNFVKQYEDYKWSGKTITFSPNIPSLSLELKFVCIPKIFNDGWTITTAFNSGRSRLHKLSEYLNERHPRLSSLLELDIDKEEKRWILWLANKGIAITHKSGHLVKGSDEKNLSVHKSTDAAFLRNVYDCLSKQTDTREEWEKDIWDVRVLNEKYGINYNRSKGDYSLDFTGIQNTIFKQDFKKYIKGRLLSGKNFGWGTASKYGYNVTFFFHFIEEIEPDWNDLKSLTRVHIAKYLEFLNQYAKNNLKHPNSNTKKYVLQNLSSIKTFLNDIQRYEYSIAPEKPVTKLIYPEDFPKLPKKSKDDIDYVPDFVLEQLFKHINDLHPEVQPVVWVMYETGLRISDALALTQDCLWVLNGKSSLKADVKKTYVINHKVPIRDEVANLLAVLIHKSKELSNDANNPYKFIFVRYKGRRKGNPYGQGWVLQKLKQFAYEKNIVDETGNRFYFKNHAFRHTFGVKMINGGADILTVQELLAHASPEMTLRYAKILDDKKRKDWEKAQQSGIFSFNLDGKVHQVTENEEIPEDVMDALWQDEKLNALDNPYGTCRARVNGNCPLAAEPPCLTANNGKPCFDLAIGMTSFDVKKYELHIESTTKMIEAA